MPSLGHFLQGQVVQAAGVPARLRPDATGPFLEDGALFRRNDQTYSASITPDLALGNWIVVTATNGAAFTINNALFNGAALSAANTPVGLLVMITLLNSSGGALGGVTLGSIYKGNSGFTAGITNGNSISAMMLVLSPTSLIGLAPWVGQFAF